MHCMIMRIRILKETIVQLLRYVGSYGGVLKESRVDADRLSSCL